LITRPNTTTFELKIVYCALKGMEVKSPYIWDPGAMMLWVTSLKFQPYYTWVLTWLMWEEVSCQCEYGYEEKQLSIPTWI
jgi:hypothetical protein